MTNLILRVLCCQRIFQSLFVCVPLSTYCSALYDIYHYLLFVFTANFSTSTLSSFLSFLPSLSPLFFPLLSSLSFFFLLSSPFLSLLLSLSSLLSSPFFFLLSSLPSLLPLRGHKVVCGEGGYDNSNVRRSQAGYQR